MFASRLFSNSRNSKNVSTNDKILINNDKFEDEKENETLFGLLDLQKDRGKDSKNEEEFESVDNKVRCTCFRSSVCNSRTLFEWMHKKQIQVFVLVAVLYFE